MKRITKTTRRLARGARRLIRDDSGMESVEVALGVGLATIMMGVGGFTFADGIAEYFTTQSTAADTFAPPLPDNTGYVCSGTSCSTATP